MCLSETSVRLFSLGLHRPVCPAESGAFLSEGDNMLKTPIIVNQGIFEDANGQKLHPADVAGMLNTFTYTVAALTLLYEHCPKPAIPPAARPELEDTMRRIAPFQL